MWLAACICAIDRLLELPNLSARAGSEVPDWYFPRLITSDIACRLLGISRQRSRRQHHRVGAVQTALDVAHLGASGSGC
jgi:hypothetical protein